MALPPFGDPRRDLQLAIRSSRILGILFLLIATVVSAAAASLSATKGLGWLGILVGSGYFVPGAAFLVSAHFMARRHKWAVTMGMVFACLYGVLFFSAAVMSLTLVNGSLCGSGVAFLFVLAMVQLIHHLSASYRAIKMPDYHDPRGFTPIIRETAAPPSTPPETPG